MLSLRVVIAGHDVPVNVSLPLNASVQHLCQALYASPQVHLSSSCHRLRFIVAGKNLSPNSPTLQHAGLTNGSFVHCAISDIATLHDNASNINGDTSVNCEYDDGLVTIDLGGGGDVVDEATEDGSFYDWCWGFVLGALLGLIMVVLAMDRSIALSTKWKRGIGCGTFINVVFGVLLLANDHLR